MPRPTMGTYKTLGIELASGLVGPINAVTATPGTWQRPFQHMQASLKKVDDKWVARVRDSDITDMKKLSQTPKAGSYQKWSVDILKLNELGEY